MGLAEVVAAATREIVSHDAHDRVRQLADMIHEWLEEHGIGIAVPPVEQFRTVESGMEIDR